MKLDLDTSAGDEVAEILDLLALLRSRYQKAGPMVTSRIWKAEMQMKNLQREMEDAFSKMLEEAGAVRPEYPFGDWLRDTEDSERREAEKRIQAALRAAEETSPLRHVNEPVS